MFERIVNNLINGNTSDFKKGIKRLSLNQRYEFAQHIKENYESSFNYVLYVIITKDF